MSCGLASCGPFRSCTSLYKPVQASTSKVPKSRCVPSTIGTRRLLALSGTIYSLHTHDIYPSNLLIKVLNHWVALPLLPSWTHLPRGPDLVAVARVVTSEHREISPLEFLLTWACDMEARLPRLRAVRIGSGLGALQLAFVKGFPLCDFKDKMESQMTLTDLGCFLDSLTSERIPGESGVT